MIGRDAGMALAKLLSRKNKATVFPTQVVGSRVNLTGRVIPDERHAVADLRSTGFPACKASFTSSLAARSASASILLPDVIACGPSAFMTRASAGVQSPDAVRRGAFTSDRAVRSVVMR
jgi:hypothetical protein